VVLSCCERQAASTLAFAFGGRSGRRSSARTTKRTVSDVQLSICASVNVSRGGIHVHGEARRPGSERNPNEKKRVETRKRKATRPKSGESSERERITRFDLLGRWGRGGSARRETNQVGLIGSLGQCCAWSTITKLIPIGLATHSDYRTA
jgi:hypothetical protein